MRSYNIEGIGQQMLAWRHQIHSYPETAYTEHKTSALVAEVLTKANVEVHRGIADTGVVGVLRQGSSSNSIALRADMDALHINELNDFQHRSQVPGKMHACGHDGHTAMLLGAACYLAKTKNFDGTVYFIFQPAEENEGGGLRMIEEGLFDRFPAEQIYGMHNMPLFPRGSFALRPGPMMAAFATFECVVQGKGTHSSMPESGIDPIAIAAKIVHAWGKLQSDEFEPDDRVVLTTTQFHAGDTWNVIPDTATLGGSTRCYSREISRKLEERMVQIAEKICADSGASCNFSYNRCYPPLVNSPAETRRAGDVAAMLVGEDNVSRSIDPLAGSEDFAYMLEAKPGAYILIGNAGNEHGGCMVHNPHYDFNDDILACCASQYTYGFRGLLFEAIGSDVILGLT